MELTLWWIDRKGYDDEWHPTYGPYVDQWDANNKLDELREGIPWDVYQVRGIVLTGVEAW